MAQPTVWVDSLIQLTAVSGAPGTPAVAGLLFVPDRIERNHMTLLRTILCLTFAFEIDHGVSQQVVDYAIGFASDESLAAGVLPDPEVAAERPQRGWVYRCFRMMSSEGAGIAGRTIQADEKDLLAKRKVDNGRAYLTVQNTAFAGVAEDILVSGIVRMLYLLK